MDATQAICDSFVESEEETSEEEEDENKRGKPVAKLCILQNDHVPVAEVPLFLGDNIIGREPNTCAVTLPAPSVSKQHATICITVHGRRGYPADADVEALVWDRGSMNGTRKGRLKLTPNVRYALSEGDSLVVADIPCQYVSCVLGSAPSQGDTRTPVSKSSGVKARLSDASGVDSSADSGINGNADVKASAMVPLFHVGEGDTRKSPGPDSCLSFEKTPAQPHRTLVSESDSDSDGESQGRGARRFKAIVSDSDSHKSSPTCSTFLSPTNKVVPESEDESPITPSSSTKGKPHRHVSFSNDESDIDAGRQQPKKKETRAVVDDSEEDEGREEERGSLGGAVCEESRQDVPVKQKSDASLEEKQLPAPTDAIPVFNMDSDTDVEAEEEGGPSVSANKQAGQPPNTAQFNMDSDTDVEAEEGGPSVNANQQADQPPNTAQLNMDSDTDVEEESVGPVKANQQADQPTNTAQLNMDSDTDVDEDVVPKCAPSSVDNAKPSQAVPPVEPMDINLDSDTDVDDEADEAKPASPLAKHQADSAPSTQLKDFHLDSDTDVDEEEEKKCGTSDNTSKIEEGPTRIDGRPAVVSESAVAAPHNVHIDSDTDEEAIPARVVGKPSDVSATVAGADSDTDAEEESARVPLISITASPAAPKTSSAARQCEADAGTDLDVSSVTPAGDEENAAQQGQDSDTDVEDKEADPGVAGKNETPSVPRGKLPLLQVPLLQQCSTPVQVTEGDIEDMDTQAFLSPSLTPLKRGVNSAARTLVSSSCSESLDEEDYVVAETQSFTSQTRGAPCGLLGGSVTGSSGLESHIDKNDKQSSGEGSFQLGLSDSSYMRGQAQALAMEDTQAFTSAGGGVTMEETQAYTSDYTAGGTSTCDDSNSEEPTQAYGDLASLATQAYTSMPDSDSEDELRSTTETPPLDPLALAAIAVAETLPMCAFEEEESPATEISSVHVASTGAEVTDKQGESGDCQDRSLSDTPTVTETQPMDTRGKEDLNPDEQNRSEPPPQVEEETHPTTSADYSAATQPMVEATLPIARSGNEESDEEDSISAPRKRKAKQLQLEDEESQRLSLTSTAETHPIDAGQDEESEDLIPGPRKRKAKPLEETQSLISSAQTQPMIIEEAEEKDGGEDPTPAPRRGRKAKQLQLEDEETQKLVIAEIQPMDAGEDEESEESILCRSRRKVKPLQLEDEETQKLVIAETQPMDAGEDEESEEPILCRTRRKVKPLQLEDEETQKLVIAETQPMDAGEDEESEEPILCRTRRKVKPLQLEDEETQKLVIAETQPMDAGEDEESEEPILCRTRRKVKPLQLEDEETQKLVIDETQPMDAGEDEESEEPILCRTRRKAKPLHFDESQSQTMTAGEDVENGNKESVLPKPNEKTASSGVNTRGKRMTRAQLREEEERPDCSETPKRQTRGSKAASATQGRKARSRPVVSDSEEEEEKVEEVKPTRGKRATRQKKTCEEENHAAEQERLEREKREEQERMKAQLRKEKEQQERLEAEEAEKERVRLEQDQAERERKEQEEKAERMKLEKEQLERAIKEKSEKQRLEREKAEREEKARLERAEKERREQEEKERLEREKAEREEKARLERAEKERREQEEKERSEREKAEREEKDRLERERREQEEKARSEQEKAKREEKARLARESEKRAREEKERLEAAKRAKAEQERKDKEQRERLELEAKEREKLEKEKQQKAEEGSQTKTPARGRRAARKTTATAPPPDDDAPARRTRSRSNSSNSVSSERSASSSTQGSRRGGRAAKAGSGPPPRARRRTVAAHPSPQRDTAEQSANQTPPPETLSRSNSSNSLNSEISSCSIASQSRGRGSRQRGRGTRTEPERDPLADQNSAPKTAARGRGRGRAEDAGGVDAQPPATTRGRRRANDSQPADTEGPSTQEDGGSLPPQRATQVRGQAAAKGETVEVAVAPDNEAKATRKGRKRELELSGEKANDERPGPVEAKRRGRASAARTSRSAQEPPAQVKEEAAGREEPAGRPSQCPKTVNGESGTPANHADASALTLHTPVRAASRKRQTPSVDSSPLAKTPRSAAAAATSRLRAASQNYKVLFTGVVDEEGQRVLVRLGGAMAKGVADMNCLVTDKVRRTVKFLCAVAKGIPIVNMSWLEQSGQNGSFLPPTDFLVDDPEQEKKFNFCLRDSLGVASSQPLLQGYKIHITKSVKPEPAQMKDIVACSGAAFLSKMPSSYKAQTVVISCEDDWSLCGPALSASIPVVSAEFVLSGILQQKVDLETHKFSAPTVDPTPAGGRGGGRKRT